MHTIWIDSICGSEPFVYWAELRTIKSICYFLLGTHRYLERVLQEADWVRARSYCYELSLGPLNEFFSTQM